MIWKSKFQFPVLEIFDIPKHGGAKRSHSHHLALKPSCPEAFWSPEGFNLKSVPHCKRSSVVYEQLKPCFQTLFTPKFFSWYLAREFPGFVPGTWYGKWDVFTGRAWHLGSIERSMARIGSKCELLKPGPKTGVPVPVSGGGIDCDCQSIKCYAK